MSKINADITLAKENKKFNPRIYAYSDTRWPGMLKVGYTARTVNERMREHYPTLTPTVSYSVVVNESAIDRSGAYFKDYQVHKELERMGFPKAYIESTDREDGEWFECSRETVLEAIINVQNKISGAKRGRFLSFPMRKEQQDAVDKAYHYFETHKKAGGVAPQFLWNCKMRFGKTFAAYQLMKKAGWQNVLVLTYKPAVRSAWRDDLNQHIDFEKFQFVSNGEDKFGNRDLSYEEADKSKPIVWFASFQDFLGKDCDGKMKPRNKAAAEIEWDCIIIDESHFGAGTVAALMLTGEINELKNFSNSMNETSSEDAEKVSEDEIAQLEAIAHLNTKNRLFLSGTPFKAISKGQFDSNAIYNWTYSDEQAAKAAWNDADGRNPYLMLPEVQLYTYEMPDYITADFLDNQVQNEFSLNEFFRAEIDSQGVATFVHQDKVNKWLDMIRGGGEWERRQWTKENDDDSPVMPYSGIAAKNLQHTVWYFQSVASCKAMEQLLSGNPSWNNYEIVCCAGGDVGTGEDAKAPVDRAIAKKNQKTITLSCGKLLTGVTIPEWSGIFMLNDKRTPESYFQSAFRVQSPWYHKSSDGSLPDVDAVIKPVCYIFDFSPNRAVNQIRQYAEGLIAASSDGSKEDIESAIRNFVRFLPIISCDESGMRRMEVNDLLEKIYCDESTPAFIRKVRHISVDLGQEFLQMYNENEELRKALQEIDPTLPAEIGPDDQNSSDKTKPKSGDGDTSESGKDKKKDKLTDRDKIRNRIKVMCSRIPLFMYLTDKRERNVQDCLEENNNPALFTKIVGIEPRLFSLLVSTLDSVDIHRIVYSFKTLEDKNFGYYGYNKHQKIEDGVQEDLFAGAH
jgi:hypothetical protein